MLTVERAENRVTLDDYLAALRRTGEFVTPGAAGTFWEGSGMRTCMRRPDFHLEPPAPGELHDLHWRRGRALASYVRRPDEGHPHNAWLYLCENQAYSLESLGSAARRDIRRALRTFRFEFVEPARLLELGQTSYCETRQRIGFSDGTPEAFRAKYAHFAENPAHRVLVAWAGETVAAHATLVVVDDWVDIFPYAANEHLKGCPVNGLVHVIVDHFLVANRYRVVNYGLSSIQEDTRAQSLHAFKKKVGFACVPVHRAFVVHPLLRPFVNRLTLAALRAGTRAFPGSDKVSRAAGVVSSCLGHRHVPLDQAGDAQE